MYLVIITLQIVQLVIIVTAIKKILKEEELKYINNKFLLNQCTDKITQRLLDITNGRWHHL